MEYLKLAESIHQNAVDKGFWETPPSYLTAAMLIVSELGEACEADRKGRRANDCKESYTPEEFKLYVKDTVEDEIADAAIRILDCVAAWRVPFNPDYWMFASIVSRRLISECLAIASSEVLSEIKWNHLPVNNLSKSFCSIQYLCKEHRIDLERFIDLKMAFNATRERLHGKKY